MRKTGLDRSRSGHMSFYTYYMAKNDLSIDKNTKFIICGRICVDKRSLFVLLCACIKQMLCRYSFG